jgi:4-hydroxy 2-oxovalerate aldolase
MRLPSLDPIIVDVSLRDGGYRNDWTFGVDEIHAIVRNLDSSGVDVIEVGYLNDDPRLPPAARCPVDLLESLRRESRSAGLAAMLRLNVPNATSILKAHSGTLDMARIPSDLDHLDAALALAKVALDCGIIVSINIVSISAYEETEILRTIERIADESEAICLYLADSRGAIRPDELSSLICGVRARWRGPLGFHGHDNIRRALDNSLTAIRGGCLLVDGSVNGVGLGGGNTPLDELMTAVLGRRPTSSGEILRELAVFPALHLTCPNSYIYYLAGAKNLEQEWVPILAERYGDELVGYLEAIPRRRYASIEDVHSPAPSAGRSRWSDDGALV